MKSKKIIKYIFFITFCSILGLQSCEDDTEICGEGTTPRLIIKFYDEATNNEISESGVFSTTEFSDYEFSSQDSIFLPLSLRNEVDTLFYKTSTDATVTDTIILTFSREEKYVSKGCGFKVNYRNLNATLGTSSETLQKVEFNPNLVDVDNQINITNETEAHIYIYF